jgi:hypothetical protein
MGDSGMSRTVLVHAHMFKNAGSTFDWSLQRCFGDAFVDHRDDDAMREGAAYLGPYLLDRPRLRALSSHWVAFPLPQIDAIDIRLAIFFRHPLERIRSVYTFERQQQGVNNPGTEHARKLGFVDYVRWRLQPGVGPVIRNFHTRYCSGRSTGKDLEEVYDSAIATIESTPLLGLVHRYDESMVLFEYHLQDVFPDIDLSWKLQNSSVGELASSAEKSRTVECDLEPVMEQVAAANSYDLRLFAEAESRFEQALERVPDVELRLQDLRSRSEHLQ